MRVESNEELIIDKDYAFLSNDYLCPIEYEGIEYSCVEAAYQASKSLELAVRQKFRKLTGTEARELGKTILVWDKWSDSCIQILHDLLVIKFSNAVLGQRLMDTGDAYLICAGQCGITFKDCNDYVMDNESNFLGLLLMGVRGELISKRFRASCLERNNQVETGIYA